MKDVLGILNDLRRPRLLIRAARIGAQEYRRSPHLRRVLGDAVLPRSGVALMRLLEIEAELDERRRSGDATYSVSRHVEVLTAMMGEACVLRAATDLATAARQSPAS
ncbi:DUF6477 family protein [Sagittula stellata]|uniref:Uncharacterized protein n=1 Tax=Sagittula stellata (strain ATCC 700073 / DSM 11524 / E-37) TaxID=388399 RepID=A3K6G8_SAGS3|nr:DUF6477 family protein [Sagittula stellata]EBA07318.1 hypothetical protein SSE37_06764 [Sagittula stellata E-37]